MGLASPGVRVQLAVGVLLVGAASAGACGSDPGRRTAHASDGGEGGGHAGDGTGSTLGGETGAPAAGGAAGAREPAGSAGTPAAGDTGNPAGGTLGTAGALGDAGALGNAGAPTASGPLRALAVTAGYYNSFVVQVGSRQVWAWGYQVDAVTGGYNAGNAAGWAKKPVPVQGLAGVDQVVAVSESSSYFAHHVDGTVSAWGRNTQGQLGDQTTIDRPLPVKVLDVDGTPMRGVCSIAAGAGIMIMARAPHCSTYAVGSEPPNSITGAWVVGLFIPGNIGGSNATGFPQNGAIARQFPGLPVEVEVDSMAMPDASASSDAGVLFLMANGSRYAWGYNGASNPLGAGGSTQFAGTATTAVDVSTFWTGVARAELGRTFAVASNAAQSLTGVGRNLEGQLGTGNDLASSTLVPVSTLTNVTDFSVGQVSVVAITNGQLWAWGWDGLAPVTTPGRLGADSGFTHVSRGDEHGLAIGLDQRVYVWGGRSYYALGDGIGSGHASTPALLAE